MDATIQELIAKGFYSEAQDALRAQLAKTQSELGSLDPRVAAMQLQFGDILLMCGSSVEAEKLYEELISKYGNAGEK
jgi:Arc/MetJ-type ribon-helix-helix transcriptional regulator